MSFAAMRPLYMSALGGAAAVGEDEQAFPVRQRPYSRGLLQRLSDRGAASGGFRLDAGEDSGLDPRILQVLR